MLCSGIFKYILSCCYSVHLMMENAALLNIMFYSERAEVSRFLNGIGKYFIKVLETQLSVFKYIINL